MKRQPTIEDVARKASLSISTVSLVLNNKPNVSDETRRKVQQAIQELGYHPHRGARGLASNISGNIGFILSDDHFIQGEPFYTRIFLGTEFEARNHNYYILLTTVSKQFRKKVSIPRFLFERNVDGIIISGKIDDQYVEYINSIGLPIVLVDYSLPRNRFSSVLIDNLRGSHAAVSHLIKRGHREIAFIGGDIQHPSITERLEGYKDTLQEHGIALNQSFVSVDEHDTRMDNGYRAIQKILLKRKRPTAVFAANDSMAIGCTRYLKEVGIKIPGDIAVIGFDDIDMSSLVDPQLSTIRVFKEKMGTLALQRLVEMIKSKTETVATIHVPVELIIRESTGGNGKIQRSESSDHTVESDVA